MDLIKRRHLSFRFRALLLLSLIPLIYIILFKPLRIKFNQQIIAPYYLSIQEDGQEIITIEKRRINIQPDKDDSPRGFGIPFGGYFWLPFSIFLVTRQKIPAFGLIGYHIFLGIIPPYLGILFYQAQYWAGTVLQINELIFQAVFLIALFFGIKESVKQWKNEKELKFL